MRKLLATWVSVAFALVAAAPGLARAQAGQDEAKKESAKASTAKAATSDTSPPLTPAEREKKGVIDTAKARAKSEPQEKYVDPRAKAALEGTYPELFGNVRTNPADDRVIGE